MMPIPWMIFSAVAHMRSAPASPNPFSNGGCGWPRPQLVLHRTGTDSDVARSRFGSRFTAAFRERDSDFIETNDEWCRICDRCYPDDVAAHFLKRGELILGSLPAVGNYEPCTAARKADPEGYRRPVAGVTSAFLGDTRGCMRWVIRRDDLAGQRFDRVNTVIDLM
jgi:hypothetical protein